MESVQNLDQTQRAGAAAVGGLVLATAAQLLMGRKVNLLATAAFTAVAGMAGYAIKGQIGGVAGYAIKGQLSGETIDVERVEQLRQQVIENRFELDTVKPALRALLKANGGKFDTADWKLAANLGFLPVFFQDEHDKALREAFIEAALNNPLLPNSMKWIRALWCERETQRVIPGVAEHIKKPEHVAAMLASFAVLELNLNRNLNKAMQEKLLMELIVELKKSEHEKALTYEHLKPFLDDEEIGYAMSELIPNLELTNIEAMAKAMDDDSSDTSTESSD